MLKRRQRKSPEPCPVCGSLDIVPIVYGEPGLELIEEEKRGKIALGGCCLGDRDPQKQCKACGTRFDLQPPRTMSKKLTALQILTEAHGSPPSLMTPRVLSRVLLCDGIAAELSEGKGPKGGQRFAVQNAVSMGGGRPLRVGTRPLADVVQSALFRTRASAERHLASMQEHLRFASADEAIKGVALSLGDRWTIDSEEGLGWLRIKKRAPRGKSKA